MKFERLYPVELIFQGIPTKDDKTLKKDERIEKIIAHFKRDKPDVIVNEITEEVSNKIYIYRIKGYSTNPNVR
jgi:ribosomal protein S24E